jgi:two-component system sensor histidine kinase KdpD
MTGDYKRPDPDSLLRSIREKERRAGQGRLKIFFGMAAGVGKTYAMLESAQRLRRDGTDMVIGYLETHGRAETEELARGLEVIPRRTIDYRGVKIEEMDLDSLLRRKPGVALVDELAHTNAEGSRHLKRYQDVHELLRNGINVHTTLNVQHLESQADPVEKITGVKIRETVPDSILDMADEIELVDIPPDELLKRLAEGKVYVPEKAGQAAERFFKKGNITALREMALQYVARLVDYDVRDYMREKNIPGPWKIGERLLVAVSPSPYSEYLIRWTRRMAFNLKSPWIALYIERRSSLSDEDHNRLNKNLNLARELGAEVISTSDEDVASGLIRTARQQNITQIVVGKPLRRYLSDYFTGGNLVERLLKSCGDIEVHVVSQPAAGEKEAGIFTRISPTSKPKEYVISIASIFGITFFNLILVEVSGYWTIALIYLLSVSILALIIGPGPVLLAATISAMLWNFLFIPPLYTFRINKVEDALMFGTYFAIAIILGSLTSRLRSKEKALRVREQRITELYEFSKSLGNADGIDEVIGTAVKYTERYLESRVAVVLSGDSGSLDDPHPASSFSLTSKERGVAEWSFRNKRPAGLFTDTLPYSDARYMPLITPGSVVGVLCIRPVSDKSFTLEQEGFLQNITYQLSMRIEREALSTIRRRALLIEESERLYTILLNSISHELRTPLTAITAASSSLLDDAIETRPETRRALSEEIGKASRRLNRLVDNLLDINRLESGMLKLDRQAYDLADLVSVAVRRLESELALHKLIVSIDNGLPMISVDFALMEQVLVNLLYNAVMYTPAGATISVGGSADRNMMILTVSDNGPGIGKEDIPFIFDKFRRGSNTATGGTGLGLSICKGIVEAHGGTISAKNIPSGGAVFTIRLPLVDGSGASGEESP